ncbi:4213_t:CDS:2, partial [Ambispora leptoticha]
MSTTKKSKTSFPSLKLNNTITANSDNINTNNRPVTYRLVKSYSSIDYSDLSHKQLFYKLSDEYSHDSAKQNIALLNASPTYYREVIKPDERHAKIFWFDAALMYAPGINIVTSSPLLSPAMTYDSRS